MKRILNIIVLVFITINFQVFSQTESKWSYDLGFYFFKSSVNRQPDELLYNPVFEKWESIHQQPNLYEVSEYKKAFDPYPFNLSLGVDVLFRFKKYIMIKVGYCYSNTLGIGGKGKITYTDISNNIKTSESKNMSFSSHQLNYFVGPIVPVNDKGAEVFMGFSMMSPTFVIFNEKYTMTQDGIAIIDYNKKFKGFFGNCRAIIGIQVPLKDKWRFGSELVFAYLNGMQLKSGDLVDAGFKFPDMQWNFTFRYNIK